MQEKKNSGPGEKQPGEGLEWPPTGKQGGDIGIDVREKEGGMGEPAGGGGDSRKQSGPVPKPTI